MEKAREHEKMSEMLSNFKNQLMAENCFQVVYGAFRLKSSKFGQGEEVTIGFMRDRSFEEEFFLVIESKYFNQKTGHKDKKLIPVDDVEEIEHVEGIKFEIHYVEDPSKSARAGGAGKIKGLIAKMKEKKEKKKQISNEEEATKKEKTDVYESKYVKNIIETFNNVLGLIEQ